MRVQISLTALSGDAVEAGIAVTAVCDDAGITVPSIAEEPWRTGAYVVSEREPRLVVYPNFLAPDEADYLSELARWGALEAAAAASMSGIVVGAAQAVSWDGSRPARAAASGRTDSIHLPRPCDDPAIQAIEERCAAATVRLPHATKLRPRTLCSAPAATTPTCNAHRAFRCIRTRSL